MPAIYPYGGPAPTMRDPLTGTGWTESVAGGTTIAWTAGTRARFSIPASTTGSGEINSSVFILTQESWDIAVRVQITTGDGSNATRIALIAGVDTNNSINLAMWGDGTIELGRVEGGSYLAAGFSAGPSSGQRTGGQLWLRLSNTGGVVRAMWGVGSAGAPPTSWTVQYSYADTVATKLSLGTFVRFTAFTLDTSVVAGYVVDLLTIRSSSVYPHSFA